MQAGCRIPLVTREGNHGSQFPVSRLAGGLRVGSAVLARVAVACCSRGSRTDLVV